MEITISDQLTSVLDRLQAKLVQRRPIAEAAAAALVGLTVQSFTDPSVRATAWAPLKPATLREKLRHGWPADILKRTTLLSRSWRVVAVTDDSVTIGSDRFYARFHQNGTSRGLPARPMLPISGGALTPLAVQRMTAAAEAKLAEIIAGVK